MEETYYEMDLPRENIHLRCFAHSIMNYRYHWHPDEYELSIVLKGNQEYCRGTETLKVAAAKPPRSVTIPPPRFIKIECRHWQEWKPAVTFAEKSNPPRSHGGERKSSYKRDG